MDSSLQAWFDPPVHFPRRRQPICKTNSPKGELCKLNQAQGKHGIFTIRGGGRSVPVLAVLDLGPSVFGFARQHAEVVQDQCFAAAGAYV
jgi:hypothetical protein